MKRVVQNVYAELLLGQFEVIPEKNKKNQTKIIGIEKMFPELF